MAQSATAEFYDKQAKLARDNADIAYQTALANIGRKFRIANRQLESNLEARGILRSGEGNTYRTELTAEEEADKASAELAKTSAYDQAALTLAQQMAALGSGGSSSGGGAGGGGGGTPAAPGGPARPATPSSQVTPTRMLIGSVDANERRIMAPKPPVYDFSKVNFAGLGDLMRRETSRDRRGR